MSLFGTAGIRGPVEDVSPSLALAVGQAAGDPGETFVVGRDGRETGTRARGGDGGRSRERRGRRSPARTGTDPDARLRLARATRRDAHGESQPAHRQRHQTLRRRCRVRRRRGREIDDRVASERSRLARWDEWGESERLAVLDRYLDAVEDYIRERFGNRTPNPEDAPPDEPLAGLRIAVDCGNGVGALATPQVLERLGADIVAINASVDGHFPGRESKPTPETLSEFTAFLDDGSFDLGLAHDGDADRLVVLGPDGSVIHEDTVPRRRRSTLHGRQRRR